MKWIDKIAYLSFWVTIIFDVFMFFGMPILFMNMPNFMDYMTYKNGLNPYNVTYTILNYLVFFHWGYCIWFLLKYDRYSKSLIPLLFLSVIYSPFYFYQVKIKKRPLKNEINKPTESQSEDYSISDSEFIELTRDNIINVLNLWASKTDQLELENSIPKDEIARELFDYWCDYSMADSDVISESFNPKEIDLLSEFDMQISNIENKYKGEFSDIEEFQKTPDWNSLNQLAKDITKKLNKENTVGNKQQ